MRQVPIKKKQTERKKTIFDRQWQGQEGEGGKGRIISFMVNMYSEKMGNFVKWNEIKRKKKGV